MRQKFQEIMIEIDVSKFFKYYEFERDAQISGVDFKIYKVYEGSSQMNKNEFNVLLGGVIQERYMHVNSRRNFKTKVG